MPTFVYRAYSSSSAEPIVGEIEAATEDIALQILATKKFLTKDLPILTYA